ncbi:MAG: permease prefix domain 1-containing protein, partial [Planctomycetota bacterium]
MTGATEDKVQRWLDEAATAMGGKPEGRRDALLELEATILDKVDERTRAGQVPAEAIKDVLDALGDPAEVGSTFLPPAPLLPP